MKDKSNYVAVTYRIPPELAESIEKHANETGLTRSNIVISALKNFIKDKVKDKEEIAENAEKKQ